VSASTVSVRTLIAIGGLLLLAALFARLGEWQLQRAAETRALGARFAAAAEEPALERAPDAVTDALRFRRVRARGHYVPERQFLLDNRIHDGAAGYEVLTPLALAGDDHRWVLVNRGWVAADGDRRVLPDVAVDSAAREVGGRIEHLPRPGMRLGVGPVDAAAGPVVVVVYPTTQELGALLGEPLLDYQLLLDDSAPDGFVRDWRAPGLAIERHYAYAGQWFLLALGSFGAGIVIAFKSRRGARKPRVAPGDAREGGA
jgi:surfeit locus 1 family protein